VDGERPMICSWDTTRFSAIPILNFITQRRNF
jgi:hypothetical protein